MGIRSFVKNTVKNNTNVKSWSSWNAIKDNAKTVKYFANDLKALDKPKPTVKITFDEAMKKYGLTENDLSKRMKSHLLVAAFCGALGAFAFIWALYLFAKLMFLSGLVGVSLSFLMLAYGFREHFNYFQIKQRRLDCTFNEWLSGFFPHKK
jgi:intracellular multiplication protein IcmV